MNNKKIATFIVAFVFSMSTLLLIFVPESSAITVAESTAKCKRNVKKINNRGKKMATKSAELQAKYKKANDGWKKKISDNKKYATKYSTDDRLTDEVEKLRKEIKEFESATKEYNGKKRPYIKERNSQIKSYKGYKNDCSSQANRRKVNDKMREWPADGKKLVDQTKAISEVYKTKVRQNILDMRAARKAIIDAKKGQKDIETADQSDIDALENSFDGIDIDEDVDLEFDPSEFDPSTNALDAI